MRQIVLFVAFLFSSTLFEMFSFASPQSHVHSSNSLNGPADQYIETASELSSRARANVYFRNPQSIFRGAQFSFVNVGQGNITFIRRDIVTSGQIPLMFARVYDSTNQGTPDFGPGWQLSAAESISVEDGKAKLLTESGSTIDFVESLDGRTFQLEKDYPSDYSTLVRTDAATIKTTLRTGFTKEFRQLGAAFLLMKVTARNGNEVRLSYQNGLLAKIENANHFIQVTRNRQGRITLAQDDNQRAVQYFYDGSGRLVKVGDLGGNTWTYSYTGKNQLRRALDPLQRVSCEISYDESGRVLSLQLPSGSIKYRYDDGSGLTTVIDRKQLISRFFQNAEGVTTRVVNALGEETAISLDAARNVISLFRNGMIIEEMKYDEQHRPVTRHSISSSGAKDETYSYDPITRLLAGVVSSDGYNQAFTYDSSGNLTNASLRDGQHSYSYSPSGGLTGLLTGSTNVGFSPNSDGLFASMTAADAVTSLQYKAGGELTGVTFPGGPSVIYDYQPSGLRAKLSFSDKRRAEYTYDPAGNLIASRIFDANGKQINGQDLQVNDSYQLVKWSLFDGTVTNFQYDANGNLTEIKKSNSTTRFEYDSLNRLTAVVTPQGQRFTYNYKPGEHSVIDQYHHSTILVEDLRDTGFTFGNPLQVMATRPLSGVFGSIRFSEELGTFELSNSTGSDVVRPQANIEAGLEKLFLVDTHVTAKALQSGFNIPVNTMFLPAEYASTNCCPECYFDGTEWYCPPCTPGNPTLSTITPSSAAANAGSVAVGLTGGFNDSYETVNTGTLSITASPNPASLDDYGNAVTTFTLASSILAGPYNVSVSDSGGTSNNLTFTVIPVITSISPARGLVGTAISVTITGAGFVSGSTSVNAGSNITVSNISVSSSTQLTATFTPTNSSSAGGNQAVTVSVPGGATSPSSNFFVQVPTSLLFVDATLLPDGSGPPNGCLSTQFGIRIDIEYQVLDQESTPQSIQSSGMIPHEHGTDFGGGQYDNDVGPVPGYPTSGHTTATNGTFHDVPFGICAPGAFTLSSSQFITMLVGTSSYTVRSNSWLVTSHTVGVGSVSNDNDVDEDRP